MGHQPDPSYQSKRVLAYLSFENFTSLTGKESVYHLIVESNVVLLTQATLYGPFGTELTPEQKERAKKRLIDFCNEVILGVGALAYKHKPAWYQTETTKRLKDKYCKELENISAELSKVIKQHKS